MDVDAPRKMIGLADMNRIIEEAKRHGNSFFGILGGEPFLHPDLMEMLGSHPDCYFQIFTNGHAITDELAGELRRLGNATPLISIEGTEIVSDRRRGRREVFSKTMAGLENCTRNRLITGVATSLCSNNIDDLLNEAWLGRLIELGVHYVWYHTYRVVGPDPAPELALSPEQMVCIRRFIVEARGKLPIGIVDPYWNDRGEAMCPMAMGISHHIGPGGDIEPCPVIQFAAENIRDQAGIYELMTRSSFLKDCRETAGRTTPGCVLLERPDVVKELVIRHGARDSTQRGTALAELEAMVPRGSQHMPGHEIPEEHWLYRFAKRHWFFGLGACD